MCDRIGSLFRKFREGFPNSLHFLRHEQEIFYADIDRDLQHYAIIPLFKDLKKYFNQGDHHLFLFNDGELYSVFSKDLTSLNVILISRDVYDFEPIISKFVLVNLITSNSFLAYWFNFDSLACTSQSKVKRVIVKDLSDYIKNFEDDQGPVSIKGMIFSMGTCYTYSDDSVYITRSDFIPGSIDADRMETKLTRILTITDQSKIKTISCVTGTSVCNQIVVYTQLILALCDNGKLWVAKYNIGTTNDLFSSLQAYFSADIEAFSSKIANLSFIDLQQHREHELLLFGEESQLYCLNFIDLKINFRLINTHHLPFSPLEI